MNFRSAVLTVGVLAVAGASSLLPANAGTAPAARSLGHVLIPARTGQGLPRANATATSLNWAGYAVTGSNISGVASTFRVPAVTNLIPGFAATWTGIGGYSSSDLIQAGVSEQFAPGFGPSYSAWYEILPAAETPIANCAGDQACTVNPGDSVTVKIVEQSAGHWLVSLADAGHWTYSKPIAYTSTHSSAEWIQEAPTVAVQTIMPLVANAVFDPGNTYTVAGQTRPLGAGSPVAIAMNNVGPLAEGQPSAIDADGDGFTACAYALSCPTPTS